MFCLVKRKSAYSRRSLIEITLFIKKNRKANFHPQGVENIVIVQ